jgi:putative acetyltransferase
VPRPARLKRRAAAPDVVIRRAEPDDHAGIARTMADESAYTGTLQTPFPSRDMWRKRVADLPEGDYLLVACAGDRIVAHAGLHRAARSPRRAHAMIVGMAVESAWQGKGVGTALLAALVDLADNWLNVTRLELTVFTDNRRAIALYRKFGFEVEGTHKAYALRNGRFTDVHAMARIRPKP